MIQNVLLADLWSISLNILILKARQKLTEVECEKTMLQVITVEAEIFVDDLISLLLLAV